MKRRSVRRLCQLALLTAIALTIFVLEAQIPAPVPVAGVKLGLANIVTVYALFTLSPWDALAILLVRVLLGCLCTGQVTAILYSLAGGLLCFFAMLPLRRMLTRRQIWFCSAVGAIFHNIGQIVVAILLTGTPSLIVYLPVLLLSGIITGLFTGFAAQALVNRLGGRMK